MLGFLTRSKAKDGAQAKSPVGAQKGGTDPLVDPLAQKPNLFDRLFKTPAFKSHEDAKRTAAVQKAGDMAPGKILAEYWDEAYQHAIRENATENFDFYDAVRNNVTKSSIYNLWIDEASDHNINIPAGVLNPLKALAAQGRYDEMDFDAALPTVRTNMNDTISRFRSSEQFIQAIMKKGPEAKGPQPDQQQSPQPQPEQTQGEPAQAEPAQAEQKQAEPEKAQATKGGPGLLHRAFKTSTWKRHEAEKIAKVVTFDAIVYGLYSAMFREYAVGEFSVENVDFLRAVKAGVSKTDLYRDFLAPKSAREINIPGQVRNEYAALATKGRHEDIDIKPAVSETNLTVTDTMERFRQSDAFIKALMAQM